MSLKSSTIPNLNALSLRDSSNVRVIDLGRFHPKGYFTHKLVNQTSTTSVAATTTWTLSPAFPVITGFKAGSKIDLTYHIPARNNSTSWGGFYVEPQVRFNGGAWYSLGGSGYDLMFNGGAVIGSYFNNIVFDPAQASEFSVQFQFYFKSHDGTTTINGSHDLNRLSGTATSMLINYTNQHYFSIKVEELFEIGN